MKMDIIFTLKAKKLVKKHIYIPKDIFFIKNNKVFNYKSIKKNLVIIKKLKIIFI